MEIEALPPACPLCGVRRTCPRSTRLGVLHRCQDCEFVFAVSTSDPSEPDLYQEEWAQDVLNPTFYFDGTRYRPRSRTRMQSLLNRLAPYRGLNRMLDVGCSAAFFLQLARERGWQVRGVEVSEFGVKYSRTELGIDVFHGTLHEARFPDGAFDVAVSSHVIEHVADPRGFVREMARVVRRRGAVVTTAPTQLSSPGYKLFGVPSGEAPPRHVSFFSPRTLARLMTDEGLRVVEKLVNVEFHQFVRACKTVLGWRRTDKGPCGPHLSPGSA
ncbi:MAG: class I SAM-dependent methyltransferase, partial [Zavarzinella sp.]|nr:class I SAM-dependent methyltransferase [Zavarzinella sp.]